MSRITLEGRMPAMKASLGASHNNISIQESGRLFVWGRNHLGQLGIGSTEDCHKPSCVRTLKKLGQRVTDAQFGGNGFSLILTADSKIFYSGKNVFPFNAKIQSLLEADSLHKRNLDGSEYTNIPVELKEFTECLEKEDEFIVNISAGFCHFIARTSAGNCFGWGYNSHQQLGGVDSLKILTKPDRLGVEERIALVECGNYCTLMVSQTNRIYLSGKFQKICIPVIKELSHIELTAKIVSLKITNTDTIYLLLKNNQIYKSNRVQKVEDLQFARLELLDQLLRAGEYPTRIAPANNFTSFVTNKGRLLTTYDDDSPFTPSDHFRELRKFKDFTVVNATSGLQHSLILAFPKKACSPAIEVDFIEAVETIEAAIKSEEERLRNGTPMPVMTKLSADLSLEFIRQEKRRLRQERIVRELSKDECIQIETDENNVRFIDNGVDMTQLVVTAEEIYNQNGDNVCEQMKNEKNHLIDSNFLTCEQPIQNGFLAAKTPTPNISQLIDYSDNASISSQSTFDDDEDDYNNTTEPKEEAYTPKITNDSNNNNNNQDETRKLSLGSKLDGSLASEKSKEKMKKFLRDLKSKSMDVSCRNPGTVLNDDSTYTKTGIQSQNGKRPLKVCSLM
ncbi:X-linked retinitis pigmentosa GTPase regulator isoform X2 [Malaya genurostris]|uniref:X-linked retinitis pigmentosa GTPase regulator isoform X2 n=1 Tax=Malaya genurostris TaxID=325434 RepID=UPI0026F3A2BE|nr:X-linked retinitis pigmentosa GTPase regulator isoform X2 [Malaya genurostris]